MKSMTGYGNAEFHNDEYDIEIEVKSVNSRFLDLKISSPRELLLFENGIKELISKYVRRAKLEIRINFNDKRVPEYQLDENKLLAFADLLKKAKSLIGDKNPVNLESIISQPNVLSFHSPSFQDETFWQILSETIENALIKHQQMALKEGDKLKEFFDQSYQTITNSVQIIEASVPGYKSKLYDLFKTNVEALLKDSLSEDMEKRIFLEVALYVDKSDITEELIRLKSHLHNFSDRLNGNGIDAGKSLNFIFQEMQREINTISSKYNETSVFEYILKIKEEVEKCREQIQNVE